ncbi:hypothetical protein FB451DRAFT_1188318 [Mycena latifolia]|nr:hypothetical protein FB451DRAFT_1188318 [Mycena latifolia]
MGGPAPRVSLGRGPEPGETASATATADDQDREIAALRDEVASLTKQRAQLVDDLARYKESYQTCKRQHKRAEETLVAERKTFQEQRKAFEAAQEELRCEREEASWQLPKAADTVKAIAVRQQGLSTETAVKKPAVRKALEIATYSKDTCHPPKRFRPSPSPDAVFTEDSSPAGYPDIPSFRRHRPRASAIGTTKKGGALMPYLPTGGYPRSCPSSSHLP